MSPEAYVAELLGSYQALLHGRAAYPPDRTVAMGLYRRGVPLQLARAALLLGVARRSLRHPGAPPLAPVRSLAYFLPVIEELRASGLPDPRYLAHLRDRLGLTDVEPTTSSTPSSPS